MQTTLKPEKKEWMPLLELRITVYDMLRQLFIHEPRPQLLQVLQEGQWLQTFPFQRESELIADGVNTMSAYMEQNDLQAEETFERLHWDYTQLFIGPYRLPAPPWESAYMNQEGLLFQQETLSVRQAYLRYGLLPERYGHEADDHLGLELDFMYQLAQLGCEAYEQGEEAKLAAILGDQASFLDQHLLNWITVFCEKMHNSAKTPFYQGVAQLLQGFLIIDREAVKEMMTALQAGSN